MNGAITEQELLSQPERWQALITRMKDLEGLPELALDDLDDLDEIIVFGSGSSYYLALLLAELIELKTRTRARALPSCEVFLWEERYLTRYDDRKRLGIGISRSGESSEALIAADVLGAHGVPILAVGCSATSTLSRKADHRLVVPEGHEDGLVMLRSFTTMLLGFQLFLGPPRARDEIYLRLPAAGRHIIARYRSALEELANKVDFRRFVVLGSRLAYPPALEAALKFQEMAITTSEAYHTLEYRHGPKSTVGRDTLVILFDPEGHTRYGVDLIKELSDYGATTLVIGETAGAYRNVADQIVELESGLTEADRLVLTLLPVHLLALETANRLGQNPDRSRNLSQVVKF